MTNEKIFELISNTFGVNVDKVNIETSIETLEEWDSVNHMNLVMALEEEFGITLTDEQMIEITSVKTLKKIVEEQNG
jgi:acyl carrier protein